MHITQDQLVAARGLLRWPQKTLAKALEISATQICDYECGLRMSGERMNEIVEVLQDAGIIFLDLPEGRVRAGAGLARVSAEEEASRDRHHHGVGQRSQPGRPRHGDGHHDDSDGFSLRVQHFPFGHHHQTAPDTDNRR